MAVRDIVLYPNPILRQKATPADHSTAQVAELIRDLWDTLDAHTGVGLAAPQIADSTRVIVVDATRARRPVPNHGRLALLNPVITSASGSISFREGCLSIPDVVSHVRRPEQITVNAMSPDGEPLEISATGFEAVIIHHEIDHLDGVLFIDRVRHARDLKFRETRL